MVDKDKLNIIKFVQELNELNNNFSLKIIYTNLTVLKGLSSRRIYTRKKHKNCLIPYFQQLIQLSTNTPNEKRKQT